MHTTLQNALVITVVVHAVVILVVVVDIGCVYGIDTVVFRMVCDSTEFHSMCSISFRVDFSCNAKFQVTFEPKMENDQNSTGF